VPHHAYSTYTRTSSQVNRDQKSIKRAQTTPKSKEGLQNLKNFHKNFSHKYVQKGYMTPSPALKSHNVLIGSRGATTKNKNTKIKKTK